MTHIYTDRKTLQLMKKNGLGDGAVKLAESYFSQPHTFTKSHEALKIYIFSAYLLTVHM